MTTNRTIYRIVVMSTVSAIALHAGIGVRLAHAAAGDIFNLGTLGGASSGGAAINDSGQVAGTFYQPEPDDIFFHAFRYSGTPGAGGAMADLGTLGGTYSIGYAINAAGQVAGHSDDRRRHFSRLPLHRHARLGRRDGRPRHPRRDGAASATPSTTPGRSPAAPTRPATLLTRLPHCAATPVIKRVTDDLGTLGGTHSFGCAINDAGQVAGIVLHDRRRRCSRLPLHRHARLGRRDGRPRHARRDGELRRRHQRRRAGHRLLRHDRQRRSSRLPLHRHARLGRRDGGLARSAGRTASATASTTPASSSELPSAPPVPGAGRLPRSGRSTPATPPSISTPGSTPPTRRRALTGRFPGPATSTTTA